MVDNLKYDEPGSGPNVATDDVGSIHFQKMKLDVGDDGVSSPVTSIASNKRFEGGLTPVTATVTASGDTTIDSAPGVGFAIDLRWVSAITDLDEATSPLIIVKASGGTEYYRAYAISHWEPFTLPENTALVVNLSQSSSVAVTIHRKIVGV